MAASKPVQLRPPYLVFVGDQQNPAYAKTGFGLVDWCKDLVVGQLRLSEDAVDLGVPDVDLRDADVAGARSLLIGVAPVGGTMWAASPARKSRPHAMGSATKLRSGAIDFSIDAPVSI